MKQLRVAILGQGRSGRNIHGANLAKMPDKYKIVAAVDLLEGRRNRANHEYGCDTYAEYKDLFNRTDIDLVVNATPSHLHTQISDEFLNAGFNVLCEKPLTNKVSDVDMLEASARKNEKFFAGFQECRYAPQVKQVNKIITSGVLGRIVQISIMDSSFSRRWDWQTLQDFNGGYLLNKGPHLIDQALQLFGTDSMPEITCKLDRTTTFGDADDYVKILFQGKNRPLIDIEMSSCCPYPSYYFNIQAVYGGVNGTTTHMEWKYYKPEEAPKRHVITDSLSDKDGYPIYCGEALKWYNGQWDVPDIEANQTDEETLEYYEMLYKTLCYGVPIEITIDDIRRQIQVIEECFRQNR